MKTRRIPVLAVVALTAVMSVEVAAAASAVDATRPAAASWSGAALTPRSAPSVAAGTVNSVSYVSRTKVRNTLLTPSQAKSASHSRLVSVSGYFGSSKATAFSEWQEKRKFTWYVTGSSGAVPGSISIIQQRTKFWAKYDLNRYYKGKRVWRLTGQVGPGKLLATSTYSVSNLFRYGSKRIRVAQTITVTGSAEVVTACSQAPGKPVTDSQLVACSRGLASAQVARSAGLFRWAPADVWRIDRPNDGDWSWRQGVTTSPVATDLACYTSYPSGTSVYWCSQFIPIDLSTNVSVELINLSATHGIVYEYRHGGRLGVLYLPDVNGPYNDTIHYTIRNTSYHHTAYTGNKAGAIDVRVYKNYNYA